MTRERLRMGEASNVAKLNASPKSVEAESSFIYAP